VNGGGGVAEPTAVLPAMRNYCTEEYDNDDEDSAPLLFAPTQDVQQMEYVDSVEQQQQQRQLLQQQQKRSILQQTSYPPTTPLNLSNEGRLSAIAEMSTERCVFVLTFVCFILLFLC
jgi:hypothetical protein